MSHPTGKRVLDGILWGGWKWVDPAGRNVNLTYHFDEYNYGSVWSPPEKTAYRQALQEFSKVSKISFRETDIRAFANLIEYSVPDANMPGGALGMHEPPDAAEVNWWGTWQEEGWYNWQGWSLPSSGLVYDTTGLKRGGYGFTTLLHEIGHALGLGHPHDTSGGEGVLFPGVSYGAAWDWGSHRLNQGVFTVMSYNSGWEEGQRPEFNGVSAYGYNKSLAAFDIAAIQYLYGADANHNGGDTTYRIVNKGSWQCIWDTGGRDRIVYDGKGDVVIDLRSATLDNSPGGGGYLSHVKNTAGNAYYGGFSIAGDYMRAISNRSGETGVIIENARGGAGDDRLQGNKVANVLTGKLGDDRLIGGGGDDRLIGNFGKDTLRGGQGDDALAGGNGRDRLEGGAGRDMLDGGKDNDLLLGGARTDRLFGAGGSDRLHGGHGGDRLNGGWGPDILRGGPGADTFTFRTHHGRDTIKDFENNLDTIRLDPALWKGNLSRKQVVDRFAEKRGGDVVLDFGDDELRLEGWGNRVALVDDIEIA